MTRGVKWRRFIVLFKWNWISLRKCPYDHWLTNNAYLSVITVTNISKNFTYKMAAKINWHKYGTKLRHYHPLYVICLLRKMKMLWSAIPCGNQTSTSYLTALNTYCPYSEIWEFGLNIANNISMQRVLVFTILFIDIALDGLIKFFIMNLLLLCLLLYIGWQ